MPKRTNDGLKKRCTCSKRQWAKCSHPWHFSFHRDGREHRYSLDVVARSRGLKPPTSKTAAEALRDTLRGEIRNRTFEPVATSVDVSLTVGDLIDRYLTDYVGKKETDEGITWSGQHLRPKPAQQADYQLRIARACAVPAAGGTIPFGAKPLASVAKADIEAIRGERRQRGLVGSNRMLARLRHLFNWAIGEGFIESSPFKRHGVSVVRLETSAETPRTRRLEPGEEERLLAHAGDHLRALIVAALSTGCRVGELLSLQWHQIREDEKGSARWIELPASKTKTNTARVLPIGPRLRAELAMRRQGPDGEPHATSAYVFGDEAGGQIKSIKRAWEMTVLRAHGHTPAWVKGKPGQLASESRSALRTINLHFHDLRRQFACTLLESSADLHDVRDFLGHANITTTSRYLASSPVRLARALERLEGQTDENPSPIRTPFAQKGHSGDQAENTTPDKSVN
ncbi:MAG TPA: site-specific integrase [Vicinamibacterales bacterium]|nr:site-specific integrase [Vicinamibacterales bacterium]